MSNLSKFHSLSLELQSLIMKHCDLRDISRLSQTSRHMYELTVPITYRHINLSSHRNDSDDLIDLRSFSVMSPQHENNVRRQNAFIDTILRLPTLGEFVLSLTWTLYPRQCSYQQQRVNHIKMWQAWELLARVRRLDIYSLAGDWRDFIDFTAPAFHQGYFAPSAAIPPALFPEATFIRIGGLMPYTYFRVCVSTPSIIVSLDMENLQGLLQPRDLFSVHSRLPQHAVEDFWRNHTRYKETEDENGIPLLRHCGPMRGHLQPLLGKFVQLKNLKISTAGREVIRDDRWSAITEKARYFEMAKFITSVAPTLITFEFE
ncbi:hypothetical protein EAE96_010767 [Botrytis aclada]|nr:hypothetical protein EAE96_010767 [Botrytis aclada]